MKTWTDLNGNELVALNALGGERGVYVLPTIVKMFKGDGNAAIVFHYLLHWSRSEAARTKDGWFYATTYRIHENTGINPGVQERVRVRLTKMGFLETKREGVPARNYYRLNIETILSTLASVQATKFGLSIVDSTNLDESNQPHYIVNREVNTGSSLSLRTSEIDSADAISEVSDEETNLPVNKAKRRAKINVLGSKYDDFIKWVIETYPRNKAGLGVIEAEAVRAANKLGDTFTDAKLEEAEANIREFTRGLKNLSEAVKTGKCLPIYVPNFDNFAGTAIMYGKVPFYKKWADAQNTPSKLPPRRIIT